MISLYNIDDAFILLKKKKQITLLLIFSAVILLFMIVLFTCLSNSYFIMVLDIILTTIYLWILFTYVFYFKKVYNDEYHFLAVVEQFEHEIIEGEITLLEKEVITIKNMEVYTMKVSNRIIYIECQKLPDEFNEESYVKLEVVDNFVIGYEGVSYA